jgi:hypothetical protein
MMSKAETTASKKNQKRHAKHAAKQAGTLAGPANASGGQATSGEPSDEEEGSGDGHSVSQQAGPSITASSAEPAAECPEPKEPTIAGLISQVTPLGTPIAKVTRGLQTHLCNQLWWSQLCPVSMQLIICCIRQGYGSMEGNSAIGEAGGGRGNQAWESGAGGCSSGGRWPPPGRARPAHGGLQRAAR